MQQELKGSPNVRLLKDYLTRKGKVLKRWKVVRRKRDEALEMIKNGVAELYTGPLPPKKMKINLKDLTWQRQEQ